MMSTHGRLTKIVHFNLRTFRAVLQNDEAALLPKAVRDAIEFRLVRLYFAAKDARAYDALPHQLAVHVANVRDALRPIENRSDLASLSKRLLNVCDGMRRAVEAHSSRADSV